MFDLRGKVAVVTGGGKGIGRGIARCLTRGGSAVVIAGRTVHALEDAAEEMRSLGGRALVVPTDVTRPEEVAALVARAENEFGPINVWVNNAGSVLSEWVGPLIDLREDQFDSVVDLNLKWTFFCAQAAARRMIEHGKGGVIVNISSRAGSTANPRTGHYGAAKAALDNLTMTMAAEWGHHGIRVNGVAPGVVPINDSGQETMVSESRQRRQIETVPLRRLGTPDDIGAAVAYLASDEAGWITGETIHLNGGSRIAPGYLTYMEQISRASGAETTKSGQRP